MYKMKRYSFIISFFFLLNLVQGQIKIKTVTAYNKDSSVVEKIVERYNPYQFMVSEDEYDKHGNLNISIKHTRINEYTTTDSIFEFVQTPNPEYKDGDTVWGKMQFKMFIRRNTNKYGQDVKTETYYPDEEILHSAKYYYLYSPEGKLMVSGAFDDNSDSVLVYKDYYKYNKIGRLISKSTHWSSSPKPSSIVRYTYYPEGQFKSMNTTSYSFGDSSLKTIDFIYNKGLLTQKDTHKTKNAETKLQIKEHFLYNSKGDCTLHTISMGEDKVWYKTEYVYY